MAKGNPRPSKGFKKGQSGNPGGQSPKITELRDLIQKRGLVELALNCLEDEVRNKGKKRVECSQWLLEMKFGKAKQQLDHTSDGSFKVEIIAPPIGILKPNGNNTPANS